MSGRFFTCFYLVSITALRTDSNFSLFSKQGHLLRRLKVKFQEKNCPGFTAEQQKVSVVEEGGTWGDKQ